MRDAILNEAAVLIKQYGIRKFTIDEIAAALKISKKTIYQYFSGKDDIIRCYIESSVTSDRECVAAAMKKDTDLLEKIRGVIHSVHTYPLTVDLLNEVKQFYPEQWKKIEELMQFKTDAVKKIGRQGIREQLIRPGVSLPVLTKMIQEISSMFTDYEFLAENRLKTGEAVDCALDIILNGILRNQASSDHAKACSTKNATITDASDISGISPSTNEAVPESL
ncbi:MAG: TetR/AcrR family transcriptional regulator [Treponema sp.]